MLTSTPAVNEAVIVSTCNRTEIYCVTASGADGPDAVIDFIADYHGLDRHELVRYLYISEGEAVVRHLFRVVASLDSMVLGEAQILGQVKEAYECVLQQRRQPAHLQQAVPPELRARQARAQRDRDRRERGLDQLRGRRARQAGLRHARGPHHPGPRRRQDERADRQAPGVQRREEGARRQPHVRARRRARRQVRRRGDRLRRHVRPHARGRHRHLVDRRHPLRRHQGAGRGGAQGPQGQPRSSSSTSRCRATSTRPSTTWPTSTSTTSTTSTASSRRTSRSACARPSAPRSSSPRRWTPSSAGSSRSTWCRPSPRCARRPSRSASPRCSGPSSGSADSPRRNSRPSRSSSCSIVNKMLHGPTERLKEVAGDEGRLQLRRVGPVPLRHWTAIRTARARTAEPAALAPRQGREELAKKNETGDSVGI